MTCHLVQPRDPIYVKSYGFLSFANDMDKNVGKNLISLEISKET